MSKIILHCVQEGSRLRIKFFAFIDQDGKIYKDSYNPGYNCQFPKDIRSAGAYYEIPDVNLTLSAARTPFYRVKRDGIKCIPPGVDPLTWKTTGADVSLEPAKVYTVDECVICLTSVELVIMAPCGHQCTCSNCYKEIPGGPRAKKCPLCRRIVATVIHNR